jgi:hypothetical protein
MKLILFLVFGTVISILGEVLFALFTGKLKDDLKTTNRNEEVLEEDTKYSKRMKVYELLKKENLNKKYKDNKGDFWKVTELMGDLILVMANEGSSHADITTMYYLNEIFELDFVEV